MNKFLNRCLLIGASVLLSSSVVNAKNTVCYKNNWNSPSTIENIKLDGGECNGKYSITQMKELGWSILDIKIDSSQNNLSYKYVLTTDIIKSNENQKITSSNNTKKLSLKAVGIKIDNVKDNKSTIKMGNLIVGQSAIVLHINNKNKMIIASAKVIQSNQETSIVEYFDFTDLKQDAIPTTNLKVAKNDILVFNYLYTNSLLIVPNQETFELVKKTFKHNAFMHPDIFATKMKVDQEVYPKQEYLQEFAIKQNLGTIFIVVDKKIHILDTKTFKILTSYKINYDESQSQQPFYTRVEDIEGGLFDFDLISQEEDSILGYSLFTSDKDISYEDYYKRILGLKK